MASCRSVSQIDEDIRNCEEEIEIVKSILRKEYSKWALLRDDEINSKV